MGTLNPARAADDRTPRGTASAAYPLIAAEKFEAALSRVSRVHERFSRELGSMAESLAAEAALADDCAELASKLPGGIEDIGEAARDIERALGAVEASVEAGRAGLEGVVQGVRERIAELEGRTAAMRDISGYGARVAEGAGRVAEIADENRLIAINASVSASKAGDRVKGFKVIASEISRLSGAMAARVPEVIRASSQVGSRMEQIMAGMDGSIAGARRALGAIDEAFARLDTIGGALREAADGAVAMLAESGSLAEGGRAIDAALGSMREAIARTRDGAAALSSQMGGQGGAIGRLAERMPGLVDLTRAIEAAAGAEPPKVLRLNEIGLDRYDPALTRMIREIHYTSYSCIRLLRYSSEKKIVPYLAETWFLHPDGRTWEFALRRDARFSDGSPVGSADVRFSFERLLNPAIGSPYAQLFSIIEGADEYREGKKSSVGGIETPDAHTVRFRLREPNNFFLSLLALGYSAVIKADPAYASRPLAKEELVSAGPFAQAPDPEPGVDRLVANPHFVNGRPFIDEIRIRRTDAPPLDELLAGRVDLVYNLTAAAKRSLEAGGFDGGFTPYTSRYCYGLVTNFSRPSLLARSAELRLAVSMGLDKEGVIGDILQGAGVRADCVIPSSLIDIGGKPFVPYEPSEAKRRVEALGAAAAPPIKIAIREYPTIAGLDRLGAALVACFDRLGLKITVDYHPLSKPIGSYRDEYDLIFIGFLPEIDLYSAVEPFINPEGGDNYFGYANPALFKELDATRGVKDEGERRARFVRILKTLTQDAFMIPIFFQQVYCAFRRGVRGVYVSAEETVMPEILFIAPDASPGLPGGAAPGDAPGDAPSDARGAGGRGGALDEYAAAVGSLERESKTVLDGSRALIGRSASIEADVDGQRPAVERANGLFSDFSGGAERVEAGAAGLDARIVKSSAEASTAADAAKSVGAGLVDLGAALTATTKSLASVLAEVEGMLETLGAIRSSNEFISSIAVNAAIIAAKSDGGTGELRKVSQSIAAQATRNTEHTERLAKTVEEMREAVLSHKDYLTKTIEGLERSATGAAAAEAAMAKALPLLGKVSEGGERAARATAGLGRLVDEERRALSAITAKADALSQAAETLRFGMDLERAVADILADVGVINRDVLDFSAGR